MDLIQRQIANEYKSTHHLVSHVQEDLVKSGLSHLAQQYIDILREHISEATYEYIVKGETKVWTTKKERHEKLMTLDLEELAWKVIAICTVKPVQTYTQCVGMIKGIFKNDTIRQDIEQASECIALLPRLGLVEIKLPADSEEGVIMIHSKVTYDGDLGSYLDTTRHIMPSILKPKKVESNKDSGYLTFGSSVILAGKYHKYPVPLDHINKCNSVALSINPKALEIEPEFDEKYGEDPTDRLKRYEAWRKLNVESMETFATLVRNGNKFYLTHKYDERLRTYAHGYQCNTQGDSYRKSVIELANKEIIRME